MINEWTRSSGMDTERKERWSTISLCQVLIHTWFAFSLIFIAGLWGSHSHSSHSFDMYFSNSSWLSHSSTQCVFFTQTSEPTILRQGYGIGDTVVHGGAGTSLDRYERTKWESTVNTVMTVVDTVCWDGGQLLKLYSDNNNAWNGRMGWSRRGGSAVCPMLYVDRRWSNDLGREREREREDVGLMLVERALLSIAWEQGWAEDGKINDSICWSTAWLIQFWAYSDNIYT